MVGQTLRSSSTLWNGTWIAAVLGKIDTIDTLVIENHVTQTETVKAHQTIGDLWPRTLFACGVTFYTLVDGIDCCHIESIGTIETVAITVKKVPAFCALWGLCELGVTALNTVFRTLELHKVDIAYRDLLPCWTTVRWDSWAKYFHLWCLVVGSWCIARWILKCCVIWFWNTIYSVCKGWTIDIRWGSTYSTDQTGDV